MATSVKFAAAVQSFSAKYNNATNKIDLNFTEPLEVTTGALPKPRFYTIAYREGNFPPPLGPEYDEDYYQKYQIAFIASTPGTGTFSWTPIGSGTTWSFGIWPVFELNDEFYDGVIKLLTYTKEVTSEYPLSFGRAITVNNETGDLYIRNGYKINSTDNSDQDAPVINKLDLNNDLFNVTAKNTNTLINSVNLGALTYNNVENKLYTTQYTKRSVIDVATGQVNNYPFIEIGFQLLNATCTDIFYTDPNSNYMYVSNVSALGRQYPGIYKFDKTVTTLKTTYSGAVDSIELLETIDMPADGDLYKYKIYLDDTSFLSIGQVIDVRLIAYPASIIVEIDDNVSVTVYSREQITNFSFPNLIVYNLIMVSGNVISGTSDYEDNLEVLDTNLFYNQHLGISLSRGFVKDNYYYAMRNFLGGSQDFIKINLNTGMITVIGVNTSNVYVDVKYNDDDGYAYAVTNVTANTRVYRKDITDNTTTFIAGSTKGEVDGVGSEAQLQNIQNIVIYGNKIYILCGINNPNSLATGANSIRVLDIPTATVGTLIYQAGQPVVEEDEAEGNSDVSDNGTGDIGLGNGDYRADVPPYNSVNPDPVVVRNPEDDIIGTVPMPPGLPPNPVVTFRKNWDRLYILVNGKIIWSYRLTPWEMFNYNSGAYRGWYQRGTRTPVTTPEDAIQYPVLDGQYYVFDGTVVEPMASPEILFTYGKNYVGQALIVYDNGDVIIDRVIDNDDVLSDSYIVRGGRKYKTFTNQYGPSPLLPRYVIDYVVQAGYYEYLIEVEVSE